MGLFLTVEGPDGAGKTTQIELLRDYLSDKGYDIIVCREPGGTPISEAVRNVILNKEFTEMGHMTELLLYAAKSSIDRRSHSSGIRRWKDRNL